MRMKSDLLSLFLLILFPKFSFCFLSFSSVSSFPPRFSLSLPCSFTFSFHGHSASSHSYYPTSLSSYLISSFPCHPFGFCTFSISDFFFYFPSLSFPVIPRPFHLTFSPSFSFPLSPSQIFPPRTWKKKKIASLRVWLNDSKFNEIEEWRIEN